MIISETIISETIISDAKIHNIFKPVENILSPHHEP